MIPYYKQIAVSSNRLPLYISHEEVNAYDFEEEAFIEVLKKPEEIRLYFDIDETIKNEEDYKQFLEWLTKVSEVFGPYSIGEYSNDGINWTARLISNSRNWFTVCYGLEKFVAVSMNSEVTAYLNPNENENAIVDVIYPINSVYISVDENNPHYKFGGTWSQVSISGISGLYFWQRTT